MATPFESPELPAQMAALDAALGSGGDAPSEVIVCQACNAALDSKTGVPVEPVGPENVAYLQQYVESQAGGGLPAPPPAGPAPGGMPPLPPL